MSEKDLGELIEVWQRQNRAHRFEGDGGLENLEKLFEALGYKRTGFRFGEVIEVFLSDNPGAVEAILEWIEEQNLTEWRENIESTLEVEEEDEEEEEQETQVD